MSNLIEKFKPELNLKVVKPESKPAPCDIEHANDHIASKSHQTTICVGLRPKLPRTPRTP